MNYSEWEEWFLRANKKTYEAEMKVFAFEDINDTSSESYYSWRKEAREWRENQDYSISEHPNFHSRYIENRGKPSQSKTSAQANGGENLSSKETKQHEKAGFFVTFLIVLAIVSSKIHYFNFGLTEYLSTAELIITIIQNDTIQLGYIVAAFIVLWLILREIFYGYRLWIPILVFILYPFFQYYYN